MSPFVPSLALIVLVAAALVAVMLATVCLLRGPQAADRVVALDIFLAGAVALCVAAALETGNTAFLDVALGLALAGFVATIGWARLVERRAASETAHGRQGGMG